MAADDSDCELVIDETIVEISSDSDDEIDSRIFHPMSITSADLQAELFHEDDTNTCSICKESFRYNIALICHMQMEHVAAKTEESVHPMKRRRDAAKVEGTKKVKPTPTKAASPSSRNEQIVPKKPSRSSLMPCICCKMKFADENKRLKHLKKLKLTCFFCNLKFCWESKYKKHLHKTHKMNAVVICRLCSRVFDDMTQLACHTKICPNRDRVASSPERADDANAAGEEELIIP